MGNSLSWVTQTFCPEEQVLWVAAKSGDLPSLQQALARLTPENRGYLEWKDPVFGYTPLANACAEGNSPCVISLLDVGADANARDVKGLTPLHLAISNARSEVVRLLMENPRTNAHARTATKRQTPLDLARYEYNHVYDGNTAQLAKCIEHIEKKLCVYSGWLYQRVDNLLSYASGISSLNSWKRRYCMVLQTADTNVVEIDLFNMKPGDKRPACPTVELVYKLSDGLFESTDPTWFNRKEHRFSLSAYTKDGINRVSAPQTFDFAATNHGDLVSWKTFFGSMRMGVAPTRASSFPGGSSSAAVAAPSVQPSMLDEQRDLERALQLSLEEESRRRSEQLVAEAALATPSRIHVAQPTTAASAPPWSDAFTGSPEVTPTIAPDGVEIVQPLELLRSPQPSSRRTPDAPPPTPDAGASNECVICFDGPKSTVCVPCGHNAICTDCADQLVRSTKQCPVCRVTVREIVKIYHV